MGWHTVRGPVENPGEDDLGLPVGHILQTGLDCPGFHRVDRQQTGGHVGGNLPCLAERDRLLGEEVVDKQRIEWGFEEIGFLARQKPVGQIRHRRGADPSHQQTAGIGHKCRTRRGSANLHRCRGVAIGAPGGGRLVESLIEIKPRRHFDRLANRRTILLAGLWACGLAGRLAVLAGGCEKLPGDIEFDTHPLRPRHLAPCRRHHKHDCHPAAADSP